MQNSIITECASRVWNRDRHKYVQTCLIGMDLLSQATVLLEFEVLAIGSSILSLLWLLCRRKKKILSNWIVTIKIILHFSTEVQLSIHYQSHVTPGSTIWKSMLLLDISTEAKTFPIQYFQSTSAVLPLYCLLRSLPVLFS